MTKKCSNCNQSVLINLSMLVIHEDVVIRAYSVNNGGSKWRE